jgi:hypothetical protein
MKQFLGNLQRQGRRQLQQQLSYLIQLNHCRHTQRA